MRRMTMTAAGLLAAVLAAGCGDAGPAGAVPTVPAEVTVTRGGQPAAGAVVLFTPAGGASAAAPGATGVAGPDGVVKLTTYRDGDGAPAGDYLVAVTWPDDGPARKGGDDDGRPAADAAGGKDKLGGRYADPARSKLRRTVAAGAAVEPIVLP